MQQQRTVVSQPFVSQPAVQSVTRISREHPYYSAARNASQIRAADRQSGQQAASLQQMVRPDSPNLLDSQLWQQARQQPPLQQQIQLLNNTTSIARDEILSQGLASVAEGVPMFNQSPGVSGAVASALRRQTSQNTRTVTPQFMSNPLIIPNTNISTRDQRWASSLEGVPVHADTPSAQLAEQMQRRMRGSISSPVGRDAALIVSGGLPSASLPWMYAGSTQPSRFSPGISLSAWSNDALRHLDPSRTNTTVGTTLQSIQTASTLVSDFDNWFDTQNDSFLAQHGIGDLGDSRPG